jgi:hypothetical protein
MLARAVARGESRFAARGLLGVKTGRAGVRHRIRAACFGVNPHSMGANHLPSIGEE